MTSSAGGSPAGVDEVLDFWFADPARAWRKDPAFDAEVRARFEALHDAIEQGEHEAGRDSARGALAYVIALDQLSRNMYRDTARMFASDARARAAARDAVDRGLDQELPADRRAFLYMPFMHSEDLADQERSIELFAALGGQMIEYAERHRDIVRRFGRFPHRNALLGRASTDEERAFLTQPGSSF